MRGAASAPKEIRRALFSDATTLMTESGVDLGREGAMGDLGDLSFRRREDIRETIEKIGGAVSAINERGKKPIFLGGDHFVTYPVIRALGKKIDALTIVHLDAHADIYDSYGGNIYSHASPFARIMEERLASRLITIGVRTMNDHQREQVKRFGVEVVRISEIGEAGGVSKLDRLDLGGRPVYVSFDMDVLDPAFAPGVSHHEPGGMTTRQAIDLIDSIDAEIVGADVVELNPRRDGSGITAAAAAKIVKEIAGVMIGE
ncbi:MAG: agmatinase [Deltaproteobacteria bacterium]|uniref:Agmatinase n=1 Tax=Candidatus Zymogenus saltonus TaxID=2844893 RepID=A0A9D8KGF1_9DELT|nr:agmatinase [Candidatus Zymogenus saltonus]